jgi:antitoxin (DNA-binding transcriptional repressor) of toxin-antitoxin stability system
VSATDACAAPILRLGSFVLAEGERIKINVTGQPGVRLVGVVGPDRIRHFQVGKGEAVITATDPSSNVTTVVCQ